MNSKDKDTPLSDLVINSPIDVSYAEMRWIRAHLSK